MVPVCVQRMKRAIFVVVKKVCLVILLLAFCLGIAAAEQSRLKIDDGWIIKTGDDQAWAAPDFDDRAWKGIQIGTAWEEAGFADHDGYAWYRVRVVVPKEWSSHKSLKSVGSGGFLVLSIPYRLTSWRLGAQDAIIQPMMLPLDSTTRSHLPAPGQSGRLPRQDRSPPCASGHPNEVEWHP